MKQLLTPANATFNFTAKTITFATTIPSTISHILHVTNVTRGVLYFQPQAGALFTGTYASPVLTLACSTSGHADADKLEIFYDDGLPPATAANQLTEIGHAATIETATLQIATNTERTGQDVMAESSPVVIASNQSDVPVIVNSSCEVVEVTLSLDTSAYASGDVLADTQVATNATRANDAAAVLQSIILVDEDDQKAALDLLFFSGSGTLGTENAAPSISDANARTYLGRISIGTGDYKDLGGVSVVERGGIGLLVKPEAGTRNIYVAAHNGTGTPTYTASGIKLRLGFLW